MPLPDESHPLHAVGRGLVRYGVDAAFDQPAESNHVRADDDGENIRVILVAKPFDDPLRIAGIGEASQVLDRRQGNFDTCHPADHLREVACGGTAIEGNEQDALRDCPRRNAHQRPSSKDPHA